MFSGHIYLKFFKPLLLMDDPHLSQYFTFLAFISLSGILKMQVFILVMLFQRSQVASSFLVSFLLSFLPLSSLFSFFFSLFFCNFFLTHTHLGLMSHLPQFPQYWDYSYVPPCLGLFIFSLY